ncbi:MAG: Fis family transcriptional regulator [Cyanobacteriota bacterium]|nr:Fis family transcriptional regulator [Cyanobacteriota bacterium]
MKEIDITKTLQYLATGLVEWEKLDLDKRNEIPKALRIGMSKLSAISILEGETAPTNLPEFFQWATQPIKSWKPAEKVEFIPEDAAFIDDGLVSDFARDFALSGKNSIAQVQEYILKKIKDYCTENSLEDSYHDVRKLIIATPVIRRTELEDYLDSRTFRPLNDYFKNQEIYKPLTNLDEYDEYHLCPRCKYIKRQRRDGSYSCKNAFCQRVVAENPNKFPSLSPIPKKEADQWLVVSYGVYLYGTIPGIWEVKLAEDLTNLGAKVTLWPHVDWYDLLVELPGNIKWAIDVKDWSYITPERVKEVRVQSEATETFIVIPDARESLRIPVIRRQKAYRDALGKLQLKLSSEIFEAAKKIFKVTQQ